MHAIGQHRLSITLAWLAGVYLTLAAPVSLPGVAVERVQKNLAGLNFSVLLWSDLGSTLLVLAVGALVGGVLYGLLRAVARIQVRREMLLPVERRWGGLLYALPMLAVWGIYLLAFFPAVMSSDSIDQWRQASTGLFASGHPLGHTLFIWLLKQVWDTPTIVALVQIVSLALVVSCELSVLRGYGLPRWAAWLVSALFALSPVNGSMVVTIWKDIPYSTAMLALSLLAFNIALDEETWLRKRWLGLAVGTACAGVALFRHNGFLVALAVPLLLALVYRRHWRVFVGAVVGFTLVWAFVQWPLDALLQVQKKSVITGSIAFHHIGAHLRAGTPMTPGEQAVVERVLPLDQWDYNCYVVNPIQFDPALNARAANDSNGELYRLMANLFLRSPTVDINHMLCAGSLIYRVFQPEDSYLFASQAIMIENDPRTMKTNDLGIVAHSYLPELRDALLAMLTWSGSREVNWLIWRPATYLYLLLLVGCGLVVRWRSWKMALFLAPAVIQSASLFLTNISQSFRYQYPVYLVALFALALIFLGDSKRGENGIGQSRDEEARD